MKNNDVLWVLGIVALLYLLPRYTPTGAQGPCQAGTVPNTDASGDLICTPIA